MKTDADLGHFLIDIIPDMCFVVTEDQHVVSYNERARNTLGLPVKAPDNLMFSSLLTDDSPRPLLPSVKPGTETQSQAEVKFRAEPGGSLLAHLHMRRRSSGQRSYLYIVAHDVSEQKQREMDLLRFSNVVHYTVNPIQITDASGRMIYVNPAFEKASGYTKEELIGKNPRVIASGKHSRDFWTGVWDRIKGGEVWTGEIENRRKNGDPFYTQLLISPIIDGDDNVIGYLGSHHDITKQKELERQLLHTQKMESLGTLGAGIAHEVGNPLASISSLVQVILRTSDDEFAREKLKLVDSQVRRITKIIRDLVDFSRPSTYIVQLTDVVRVLSESVEIVKIARKAKHIQFVTTCSETIPLIPLVPDQLSQVFINILLNAVDAMEGQPGTITSTVNIERSTVRIDIADTGSGMLPETTEKIFEPFFTTKKVGEGTGMGLWVSYGIIQSFKGEIRVTSKLREGTTFTIFLPITR